MSKPNSAKRALNIEAEVEHGLRNEVRILKRWLDESPSADQAGGVYRTSEYHDFDYYVDKDDDGFPLCYLEVKSRRTAFGKFGDLIVPERKHTAALDLKRKHRIKSICITEYGDGTLVEVDLAQKPARVGPIQRRDRRHLPPKPHAFYEGKQLKIIGED